MNHLVSGCSIDPLTPRSTYAIAVGRHKATEREYYTNILPETIFCSLLRDPRPDIPDRQFGTLVVPAYEISIFFVKVNCKSLDIVLRTTFFHMRRIYVRLPKGFESINTDTTMSTRLILVAYPETYNCVPVDLFEKEWNAWELRPLAACEIGGSSRFLNRRENYEWVGFSNGLPIISPPTLNQMTQNRNTV